MPRPCEEYHPILDPTCHLCRLFERSSEYRAIMDAPDDSPIRGSRRLGDVPMCIHLGRILDPAASQGQPCRAKLRACEIYGRCTVGPTAIDAAHCLDDQGRPHCRSFEGE
jgi:hypothetical protein